MKGYICCGIARQILHGHLNKCKSHERLQDLMSTIIDRPGRPNYPYYLTTISVYPTVYTKPRPNLKAERCLLEVVRAPPIDTLRVDNQRTSPPLTRQFFRLVAVSQVFHHAILNKHHPGNCAGVDHRCDRTHHSAQGSLTRMLPRGTAPRRRHDCHFPGWRSRVWRKWKP